MSFSRRQIIFIGPMGSGKTTVGKRVARQLGLAFVDCDQELENRTGASVNLIFDIEGEPGFRQRETRMLDELTQLNDIVIATGGGAVTVEENRKMLCQRGLVVYLQTSVKQQIKRLYRDSSRPLLQGKDREARLQALAEIRNPLYELAADIIVPSSHHSVPYMAARVVKALESYWQEAELAS